MCKTIDKDGNLESFTVTSGNNNIASVIKIDSTFTVSGVSYGSYTITITSSSGNIKEIPVIVYVLQVLETDELLITYAQTFEFRWNDSGSGGTWDGSFYHPITTDSFYPLGSLGFLGYYNPDGLFGVMAVKAKSGSGHSSSHILYSSIY